MAAATTEYQPEPVGGSTVNKIPSSISRVYNVPVVKDSILYADQILRSNSLAAAAYTRAESIATVVYKKAGEPLQDRLQPQIQQLDGLANRGLDYVQNKAPFIFDAKTDELVATARKPADQAYSTAKSYQDAVSSRLHDTLVASRETLGGLQARLGTAAAHVPRSTEEAQQTAHHLYEQLEAIRAAILKQSHDLPAHLTKAVQPYIEKLQKGASEVKTELGKKDVPVHQKAQHIIGITREITAESLHDAIEAVKTYVNRSKIANGDGAEHQTNGAGSDPVESTEQFVAEHTPGDHSYAEAVKQ